MNRNETGKLLRLLRTVWKDIAVDEDTITVWSWAFEDVPYSLAEDAAKRWIKTGRFKPVPAELLETIGVQSVAPGLVPEAAWAEVLREARRVGFNRLPTFSGGRFQPVPEREFSSPLIDEAVNAVGWEAICTSEKTEVVRAQFVKALDAISKRAVRNIQTGDAPIPDAALPDGVIALDRGAA